MTTVQFLGFRLSKEGIQPGTRKVQAISEFPRPKNVHDVQRYIGLTSFFRRFVTGFAKIASPLTELLKKDAVFVWTEACQTAFERLKEELVREPTLVRFESGRRTELHTDASHSGLGAMLLQEVDKKMRLTYAISRRLDASEKNYHSTKLEQLAVVWALGRLRHYLHGIEFVVISDCSAVEALKARANTPQLARWLNIIAEFNFTVKHRAGTNMSHVDALSRDPVEEGYPIEEGDWPTDLNVPTVNAIEISESGLMAIQAMDERRTIVQSRLSRR